MFICEGTYKARNASIRWDNGEVYPIDENRDDAVVFAVKVAAINAIGRELGAIPGGTTENHLKDPLSALMLIDETMQIEKTSGDIPQAPQEGGEDVVY